MAALGGVRGRPPEGRPGPHDEDPRPDRGVGRGDPSALRALRDPRGGRGPRRDGRRCGDPSRGTRGERESDAPDGRNRPRVGTPEMMFGYRTAIGGGGGASPPGKSHSRLQKAPKNPISSLSPPPSPRGDPNTVSCSFTLPMAP